jgi:adenine-specific DNA-methyltransferase
MTVEPIRSAQADIAQPLDFRLVHYLGSKLRLIQQIRQTIEQVVPRGGRVCDLFAGSGAVSLGLRHAWGVTAIDIQEYSRVLTSAILNPPNDPVGAAELLSTASTSELMRRLEYAFEPLIDHEITCLAEAESGSMEPLCDLLEKGSLLLANSQSLESAPALQDAQAKSIERLKSEGIQHGPTSVISRYYGGVYFSWKQAIELDARLDLAHTASSPRRDQLIAVLISVASDVVNTVGKQFAQPIRPRDGSGKPKLHLVRQTLRDRQLSVSSLTEIWMRRFGTIPRANHRHRSIRGDFEEVLAEHINDVDLVYADPPYTRDHYSRYYHVLETMARRDEPAVSTTTIRTNGVPMPSRGLYRAERHQSPFCIKSKAPRAFQTLCDRVATAGKPLLISYSPYKEQEGNRPRLLSIRELREIAESHFARVSIADVDGITHNKLNTDKRNVPVDYAAEILMLCHPS